MNDTLMKIQKLMNERNWSLYKLAKESDIPYSSLNSLFLKNNQPTLSTLEKICKGFHITLGEFFSNNTPFRDISSEYSKDEWELIESFRNLNRSNKKLLLAFIKLLHNY